MSDEPAYTTRPLGLDTWDDFAALVEANGGVWGGCWCLAFHADGLTGSREGNRVGKRAHVEAGTVHQLLVYDAGSAVGWCQWGPPAEVVRIQNLRAYERELADLPDWRIGCLFTGRHHRGHGVARAAVGGVLAAIREAGGGVVEAYPEQDAERKAQRGAFFHTGPETLFEGFGFTRVRRIAKWRWVMRLEVG